MDRLAENHQESRRALVGYEAGLLLERDRKYRVVTVPMAIFSRLRPSKGPYLESAYYFARHVDDILDGDRTLEDKSASAGEYVERILAAMEGGPDDDSPAVMTLYEHALSFTEADSPQREIMVDNFRSLVEVMYFDYERQVAYGRGEPVLMDQLQLEQYYRQTFEPALIITAQITGTLFSSEHMVRFGTALGRMYSINDLREDLSRGLINIPKEELARLEEPYEPPAPAAGLAQQASIRDWALRELAIGEAELKLLKLEVARQPDIKTRLLLGLLSAGPLKYRDRLSQRW